jgi:replicative DNA helicase
MSAPAFARPDGRVEMLRVPPQSVEAEQAVLGGLLLRAEAWPLVADLLTDADFYRRDHALIFRAIRELAEAAKPFDAVTLGEWFEGQGLAEQVAGGAYLVELASTTPSAANIVAYAEIVGEKSRLRRMIELGTGMVNDGFQPEGRTFAEILSEAQHRIVELQPAQRGGLQHVSESLGGWYDRFCERYADNRKLTGLPTPWAEFNRVTHGLQPSTLYLVAARPSMGKSVVGLSLALFSALREKTTGFFSLEMSRDDCHNRNLSSLAGIPHDFMVAPTRDAEDADLYSGRLTRALREVRAAPLYIDDTPSLNVRQFEARARRMHQRHPLDLLVVDHIHDFAIDPKLARFEYGAIAQVCKNLAKEWGIPVIALAQLNRNVTGRTDRRPTLGDLRESGELEQKGDVIVFLHREDYYDENSYLKGVVEMHFAKGRNLRAGERITLRHRFDEMRVEDWQGDYPREPKQEPVSRAGIGRRG